MDIALLLLRFVAGLTLAAHGAQKLFGWFGGGGIRGTGQFFESQGFKPGGTFAVLGGLTELAGGPRARDRPLDSLVCSRCHWDDDHRNRCRALEERLLRDQWWVRVRTVDGDCRCDDKPGRAGIVLGGCSPSPCG